MSQAMMLTAVAMMASKAVEVTASMSQIFTTA
jgi:hypothetical protein